MDLFGYASEETKKNEEPLAARMRPSTLEEVVGQEHIIGKDKAPCGAFPHNFFLAL